MLHCKIVVPALKPVIADVGDVGVTIVPEPDITLHVPAPITGVLPAKVVLPELTQIVCEGPAFETLGGGSL